MKVSGKCLKYPDVMRNGKIANRKYLLLNSRYTKQSFRLLPNSEIEVIASIHW